MDGIAARRAALKANRKKTAALALSAAIVMLPLHAKAGRRQPPAWYPDPSAAYPSKRYIATTSTGSGKTAEEAKARAIDSLAAYISTQFESTTLYKSEISEESAGGRAARAKESSSLSQETFARSSARLFALETTEAWRDKSTKLWHVCAFINKEKAFAMIRGEVDSAEAKFNGLLGAAREEREMFAALRLYGAAREAAAGFMDKAAFCALFNEEKTRSVYGGSAEAAARIGEEERLLKSSNPIFVEASGDVGGAALSRAADAAAAALQSAGFSVAAKKPCRYIARVSLLAGVARKDAGESIDGKPMSIFTSRSGSASVKIGEEGGESAIVFSAGEKIGKSAAYSESKAEEKFSAAAAASIKEGLPAAIASFLGGGA